MGVEPKKTNPRFQSRSFVCSIIILCCCWVLKETPCHLHIQCSNDWRWSVIPSISHSICNIVQDKIRRRKNSKKSVLKNQVKFFFIFYFLLLKKILCKLYCCIFFDDLRLNEARNIFILLKTKKVDCKFLEMKIKHETEEFFVACLASEFKSYAYVSRTIIKTVYIFRSLYRCYRFFWPLQMS